MSLLKNLFDTYEDCKGHIGQKVQGERTPLLPISHTTANAHIQISLDGNGRFLRAAWIVPEDTVTVIPCTEASGGRTSGICAHPLCDQLWYLTPDGCRFLDEEKVECFLKKESRFDKYLQKISAWCTSSHSHPKVCAVQAYVKGASLVDDLINAGLFVEASPGSRQVAPAIREQDNPSSIVRLPKSTPPEKAFVRWAVEVPGDPQSTLWTDSSVWQSWTDYYQSLADRRGLCYVLGRDLPLAGLHPARIRNASDKAKLISSNDFEGFTFRGRFTDAKADKGAQVCGVSYEVTQKAHNSLRWLLERQGYRYDYDTQAIVAWAVQGQEIPDPMGNMSSLFGDNLEQSETTAEQGYIGQDYALRLRKKIAGYKSALGDSSQIVVVALDSATPGRLAIIYYRALSGSEYLDRVEDWHSQCCWWQNHGKAGRFLGAPAPRDIAEAAYGRAINQKLRNATLRQLLPCIIDGIPVPMNLLRAGFQRVCNKVAFKETWEWEKTLGVVCALYVKQQVHNRSYQMTLERDLNSRDYLFGRLLALAERLEQAAQWATGESRETHAGRMMHRFAIKPACTWRTIELALSPYRTRLRKKRPGLLHNLLRELDEVMNQFQQDDFVSQRVLSPEFLLGYHCQRAALSSVASAKTGSSEAESD